MLRPFSPDDDPRNVGQPSETLRVAAVFVFIGAEPGCAWLPPGLARDKLGYILTGIDALRSGSWPLTFRTAQSPSRGNSR